MPVSPTPASSAPANPMHDSTSPRLWALVPCAGTGTRALDGLQVQGPKQYQPVAGQPMVLHALAALRAVQRLSGVLVVVSAGDTFWQGRSDAPLVEACGGATRAQSVANGLQALRRHGAQDHDWVLVHDAARCLVTTAQVDALIDACLLDEVGGLLALKLPDTLKRAEGGRVAQTVERGDKWLAQTPQMFHLGPLGTALQASGDAATDEASAMEAQGLRPLLVEGSAQNFKVTYPQDFALAAAVIAARSS